MSKTLITIKTTQEAARLLRIIAATTGEKQYEVMERLLNKDFARVNRKRSEK